MWTFGPTVLVQEWGGRKMLKSPHISGGRPAGAMADFIPEENIFKFKNAFSAFDLKNSGVIKVKQLGGVLRLL
jgi:hypothetical protein